MFITVKFGDDSAIIFNPDCRNDILLDSIKDRCGVDEDELVDLSDESGSVKQLHMNPLDYGTSYFDDREIVILLRVEKSIDGESEGSLYTPLLHGMDEDNEFLGKLNPTHSAKYRKGETKSGKKYLFKTKQPLKKVQSKGTVVYNKK